MWEFQSEEGKRASAKAMRLLETMSRTEKGLTEKLRQAGFSESAIQEGVAYVRSFGYLNDRRFAEGFISARISCRSRQKILQELMQKGVDRQTALEAWDEICSLEEPDEKAMIRDLLEKKYKDLDPQNEKELRRAIGFLQRRGFTFSDIKNVFHDLFIEKERCRL